MQAPRTALHALRIGPIPVQHGQRTQNSTTNTTLGRRAQAPLAYKSDANEQVAAAKSAARMAAEAAFEAPQVRSLAQPSPQVISRRTRSAIPAGEPAPEPCDSPTSERMAKSARVFRVEPAPTAQSVEIGSAILPPKSEGSPLSDSLPALAPVISHRRRIGTDKRPGPVLHVIHAPYEPKRAAEASPLRLDWLAGELDRVTPVLQAIARAQAFSLADARFAREWNRLSRKVDRLHAQVRAQLR